MINVFEPDGDRENFIQPNHMSLEITATETTFTFRNNTNMVCKLSINNHYLAQEDIYPIVDYPESFYMNNPFLNFYLGEELPSGIEPFSFGIEVGTVDNRYYVTHRNITAIYHCKRKTWVNEFQ